MQNIFIRFFIGCLTVLSLLLAGCQSKIVPSGPWVKKIDSEELSKLVINFSVKMKVEKHLELEDSWASYNDTVSQINLQYSSQRLLTLYDARLLLVELVEEFLYRLNNNTIVSYELDRYPFTADDLDIQINFESYYGRYIDELYIGLIWLQKGCVHFFAFDKKDLSLNGIDWKHSRNEPYFKSRELALLKKQADIPYSDMSENPPTKANSLTYERYFKPTVH